MIENTRPELHEPESETEQRMRADFMHAESFVARSAEDYDPADALDYREYASPWLNGEARWMHEWVYLTDATQRWRDNPAAADTNMIRRGGAMSAIEARSEDQARYIAERGIERDEYGLLTSHYVTRVEEQAWDIAEHVDPHMPWTNAADMSASAPVPVSSAFAAARTRELASSASPLATYQPGNALAASLANAERDGVER
ncbi:hypothetical protein ACW2Q0_13285 [Nocardia sp. R16R-3T]